MDAVSHAFTVLGCAAALPLAIGFVGNLFNHFGIVIAHAQNGLTGVEDHCRERNIPLHYN